MSTIDETKPQRKATGPVGPCIPTETSTHVYDWVAHKEYEQTATENGLKIREVVVWEEQCKYCEYQYHEFRSVERTLQTMTIPYEELGEWETTDLAETGGY